MARQQILQGIGQDSTVIPGGVDTSVFQPSPKLSLSTGRLTIAYILRSKEHGYTWKGTEEFWEACHLISKSVPDFNIQVVTPEGARYQAPLPYKIVKLIPMLRWPCSMPRQTFLFRPRTSKLFPRHL